MSERYFDSMRGGLASVLDLLLKLALPIAILVGLSIVAIAVKGSAWNLDSVSIRNTASRVLGFVLVGMVTVSVWSGLKQLQPAAKADLDWRSSAEASENPAPEAPPIQQYGPVAAAMVEKTYRRSITLPPDFLTRIGAEGVSALSPYLVDPTSDNVLRLADNFKRAGQDVVFTREVTREAEEPLSFDSAEVKVAFHRLEEQAYDVEFSGTYTFSNATSAPIKARFQMPLPSGGGTVQQLRVQIAGKVVEEPDEQGMYSWTGALAPGEKQNATVHYKATGANYWNYAMGSARRRVKSFKLSATTDGPVQFGRGSIKPSARSGSTIDWQLTDVVTSQYMDLKFPEDVRVRDGYLQALSVMPTTLILFGVAVIVAFWRMGKELSTSKLSLALLAFGLGLGATAVLSPYVGPLVATFIGPVVGLLIGRLSVGWWPILLAGPAAFIPAATLSPTHTGLWALLLALFSIGIYAIMGRQPAVPASEGQA